MSTQKLRRTVADALDVRGIIIEGIRQRKHLIYSLRLPTGAPATLSVSVSPGKDNHIKNVLKDIQRLSTTG